MCRREHRGSPCMPDRLRRRRRFGFLEIVNRIGDKTRDGFHTRNTRVVGALGSLDCLRNPGCGAMGGAGAFALCV
jgi:hypothetical protein